jgi:hypothetical protein
VEHAFLRGLDRLRSEYGRSVSERRLDDSDGIQIGVKARRSFSGPLEAETALGISIYCITVLGPYLFPSMRGVCVESRYSSLLGSTRERVGTTIIVKAVLFLAPFLRRLGTYKI